VALVLAVVLVQPDPLVLIFAFLTVSVLFPSKEPFTCAAFVGAAVIVQPGRMFDAKVAPAFGMVRVALYGFLLVTDRTHCPLVVLVVMVSDPPVESVHPLMVGEPVSGTESDGELPVVPLPEKLVQETVIGTELMFPANVMTVPPLRAAVTVTPGPSVAYAAVALTRMAATVAPSVTTSFFLCLSMLSYLLYWFVFLDSVLSGAVLLLLG